MPRLVRTLLLGLALLAMPALADDPFARGFDAVPLKLTPLANSGLQLEGAETRTRRSWQLYSLLDLNFGVMALKLGDQRLGDLIPFRADLRIGGSYQVLDRLEVGAELPVIGQINGFRLLADQGFQLPPPNAVGLGAPRLLGRFQILRQSEIPIVSLAAVLEARLPIGDGFSFMADRGFVVSPRLAVERAFGPVRILANGGWRFRTAPGQFLNLYVGQEFLLGGGAIVTLPDFGRLTNNQLLAEVNLATATEAPFTFRDSEALKTPLELMVGARSTVAKDWSVLVAVGRGLGESGYGREAFRLVLGVRFEHIAEPDQDGDGIPDVRDGCPAIPEDKDGKEDTDGCPEDEPVSDSDGDGVPDTVDGCPEAPGPGPLDGCPDKDGDQIPDNVDKCPDKPGPPELNGCPPPEEEEAVVLEAEKIRINNQILFEFGSNRIDPKSFPLLDEVAKVLQANPGVGPVLIEGHTDNVGPKAFNLDLSKRRAKAVEDYLVGRGIAKERLRSDGFGMERPIVPNDSPINRAKNRRTEFKLVDEIESEPTVKPAPKK
ncbi:MAG: OmpA family protein [Myxococcaceae bacterium]|jgi:outer membrane protein OmpA-like peptidoglycan-associated protein|nr:OmpA family protein [Myxococcaceae bacterium]